MQALIKLFIFISFSILVGCGNTLDSINRSVNNVSYVSDEKNYGVL